MAKELVIDKKGKKVDEYLILKLRVNTPKGEAKRNLPIIKMAVLRFMRGARAKLEGKDDNKILFTMRCKNLKVQNKVLARAARFEAMMQGLFLKFAEKAVGKNNKETLRRMIEDETSIEVVK